MPVDLWQVARCPDHLEELEPSFDHAACPRGHSFPIVGQIPHLVPVGTADPDPAYVKWIATYHSITFSPRQQAKAALLQDRFFTLTKPRVPVLDVGCGRGEKALSFPDGEYIGVDPIDPVLAGMSTAPAASIVRGVGERLPFADGAFGSVMLWGVIDHVADPDRVYAEAARVLQPGGTLCVLNQVAAPDRGTLWREIPTWVWRKVRTGDIAGMLAIAPHSILSPSTWRFARINTLRALVDGIAPHFEVDLAVTIDDGHVGIILARRTDAGR